ncbi:unnamed protein product [Rotaria socialis]|nr:unnamed protein product [Rotaria socialis]
MHKKRNYGNKRIDNWLIYLQDLIPQIIEIKYRRGIDNIGPGYLTRYETIDSDNQQQSLSAITRSITKQATTSASSLPTVTEDHPKTSTPLLKSTSILDFSLEKIKSEQIMILIFNLLFHVFMPNRKWITMYCTATSYFVLSPRKTIVPRARFLIYLCQC